MSGAARRSLMIAVASTLICAGATVGTAAAAAGAVGAPAAAAAHAATFRTLDASCPVASPLAPAAARRSQCLTNVSGGATVRRNSLLGGVIGTVLTPVTAGAGAIAGAGLSALAGWVLAGAGASLDEAAGIISQTTAPRLESAWFSSTYWRVAGLSALLTLPFLFAAGVQALLRSDITLLGRAALGYLPLAMVGVSLAAPLVMLLLAATDEMSAVVAGAGQAGGVHFLQQTAIATSTLSALNGSAFFAFMVALLTVAAALALTLEMLVREAAVYVVVLMLPLAFAALVWPARRIWAVRLVELLISLILSKFVIVAVLSLAGAAYGSGPSGGADRLLTAMALLMLSTFAPWAMLRILPFTELAAGAADGMRSRTTQPISGAIAFAGAGAGAAAEWAAALPRLMERQAHDAGQDKIRPQAPRVTPPHGDGDPGPSVELEAGQPKAMPVTSAPAAAKPRERLPGMDPHWQTENAEWPATRLDGGDWGAVTGYAARDDAVPPPDPGSAARDDAVPPPDPGSAPHDDAAPPPEPASTPTEPGTPATDPEDGIL